MFNIMLFHWLLYFFNKVFLLFWFKFEIKYPLTSLAKDFANLYASSVVILITFFYSSLKFFSCISRSSWTLYKINLNNFSFPSYFILFTSESWKLGELRALYFLTSGSIALRILSFFYSCPDLSCCWIFCFVCYFFLKDDFFFDMIG